MKLIGEFKMRLVENCQAHLVYIILLIHALTPSLTINLSAGKKLWHNAIDAMTSSGVAQEH